MVEVVSVGGAEVWLSLFVTTTATVSSVDSGSPCHWVFWTDAFQMLPPPGIRPDRAATLLLGVVLALDRDRSARSKARSGYGPGARPGGSGSSRYVHLRLRADN
jgi:hypothetical protein